jgi:hypothetical protein
MLSKCSVTIVCENVITKDGVDVLCGQWLVVTRGEELPFCRRCKQQQRTWRLATSEEIDARDRAFLRSFEQLAPAPDDHAKD